jgi:hypothetical protein
MSEETVRLCSTCYSPSDSIVCSTCIERLDASSPLLGRDVQNAITKFERAVEQKQKLVWSVREHFARLDRQQREAES